MLKVYYWPDIPNFGDLLTPLLLAHFSHLATEWAPISQADIVGVGSALEHIPRDWTGHIVGTGRLHRDSALTVGSAQVHAVRGPMSARGITGDFALGDPALIADEMVDVDTRDVELGVLPHWSDTELAHRWTFEQYRPLVISAWSDPLTVIRSVGRCRKLVTSSLHGVILADAFGIPRRTEVARRVTDNPKEGGLFKFEDYNASVGIPLVIGETQQPARGAVENRKHEVWDALKGLPRRII